MKVSVSYWIYWPILEFAVSQLSFARTMPALFALFLFLHILRDMLQGDVYLYVEDDIKDACVHKCFILVYCISYECEGKKGE